MKELKQVIHELLSGSTTIGIRRLSYTPYDIECALAVIKRIGEGIDIDFMMTDHAKALYTKLIQYFHGDPEFPGDLTKGILLMGRTGVGKSFAMQVMNIYRQIDNIKFIKDNKPYVMNFEVVDTSVIISSFLSNSYDGIYSYCRRLLICIDDIGVEPEISKHFGNDVDVISHVLSERYAHRLLTFGTTNLGPDLLEVKYDDRTMSRMYALFNFIIVDGSDFRKRKENN